MASLQIRDVDPGLIERLKAVARRERRTLGQQVLFALEAHVEAELSDRRDMRTAARRLRELWADGDERPSDLALPSRNGNGERERRLRRALEEP